MMFISTASLAKTEMDQITWGAVVIEARGNVNHHIHYKSM